MDFKVNGVCPYYPEAEVYCEDCIYYLMCMVERDENED